MANRDLELGWKYHNDTKHSASSIRAGAHYLDWDNKPGPFKIYNTLTPLLLPRETEQTGIAALAAIAQPGLPRGPERLPDLADLARLFYFSAGITKLKRYAGGEMFFRAASCTGALYEFDLYLVCGDLPDLAAGVYHFGPEELGLRLLRAGDFRGSLVHATAGEAAVAHAPATIVCSGTYWRNSWKYRARTYRHFGWDNGTLLANMLAVCAALALPSRVVTGFVDAEVNRLLDVDATREVAFSLVPIGFSPTPVASQVSEVTPLGLPTVRLSEHEVQYPELLAMHAASSLTSDDEVRHWRATAAAADGFAVLREDHARDSIEQVILRRGSSRQFKRESISLEQLKTMLEFSTRGIEADFLDSPADSLNDLYLIVNAVDTLAPGAYFYQRASGELQLLKGGDFRAEAQYLGLQQALPGDASAAVFLMADLERVFERFGNRGYRAVQLEAGIMGGKLYLAAYAQHLGATGLTFFDDDVTGFFSPHAAGKSAIFLVALGRGVRPHPL